MDIQIVLVIILSILTLNLVVVGIYVVMILKEFRETLKKMNVMMDTVTDVTQSVATPITNLSGILGSITSGMKLFNTFSSFKRRREED
jgi:uncharacterized protein YoxC